MPTAEELQQQLEKQQEAIRKLEQELANTRATKTTGDEELLKNLDEVKVTSSNLKLPTFWRRDPALWFAQVEAQFHTARITSDQTKYCTVVAALDCSTLQPVTDIVANPPDKERYDTIKKKLIAAYTDSQEKQLRKLINEMELGDRQPSQLFREMKALAGQQMNSEVVKTLWLQRLPPHVQLVLSASEGVPLEKMAEIADKLAEIHRSNAMASSINAIGATSDTTRQNTIVPTQETNLITVIADLQKQMAALSVAVTHLTNTRGRSPQARQNDSRNRSRTHSRQRTDQNGVCYYHAKFGVNARKCFKPCTFVQPEN